MSERISRRVFLRRTLGGLGVLATLGGGGAVAQVYRFEVNRHRAPLPGLRTPLRVVMLSDLHYGPFIGTGSVRAWVDAALEARPELIVMTGDFVDTDLEGSPRDLIAELSRLRAPLGVWGVWGNHDYGSFGAYVRRWQAAHQEANARLAAFGNALSAAGVRILTNQGVRLRPDLYLAGVDDFWWGRPDLGAALAGAPATGAWLLMSHNPDLLPEVPTRVGLTLSGHTHGGQVRLPLVGALRTASRYGERFVQGFVRGPAPGFVSRGLGVSMLPVRWACAPEVVVLDLEPPAG
ncbi:hypothetical protein HNR42_002133 [Deinobacterium chartae]|uniref:Calcineurin-like phosphoesterase domain-containing protein n=1 Tax=Deinobacterium chartae TaxID=521158 RepID=A0A841I2X0_9DEIO|nr:metallophosphoesterase [Deinobacterium chartae]MBB6098698.1 hypothetical protein [Deinobacterium chartae]